MVNQSFKTISIVIPVRNEAGNIEILLQSLINANFITEIQEVIVIDHNCDDQTPEILQKLVLTLDKIKVITIRDLTLKLGEAIQKGISEAVSPYVITMDGDMSHSVDAIPGFIAKIKEGNTVIIGGRYMKSQPKFTPKSRYYISKMFNLLPRVWLRKGISDYTTGFRCFSKGLYSTLSFVSKDYNFHLEINMKLVRAAEKVAEIPIEYKKRTIGQSKLKYSHQFLGYLRAFISGLH